MHEESVSCITCHTSLRGLNKTFCAVPCSRFRKQSRLWLLHFVDDLDHLRRRNHERLLREMLQVAGDKKRILFAQSHFVEYEVFRVGENSISNLGTLQAQTVCYDGSDNGFYQFRIKWKLFT